jgi:hypothetical protein
VGTRDQNERKYERWDQLPGGGRRYSLTVRGRSGWWARYVKEVDPDEKTVRFWQEIYDERDVLVEIHEKFPEDRGHRKINEG